MSRSRAQSGGQRARESGAGARPVGPRAGSALPKSAPQALPSFGRCSLDGLVQLIARGVLDISRDDHLEVAVPAGQGERDVSLRACEGERESGSTRESRSNRGGDGVRKSGEK